MFCDLVGSTELSARLDPEDLREVIAAYHRAVAEVVAGFDGFVAKYMGDGVLVYFGYPQAHEDDAEQAVRAGLGVIDAVGSLDVKSVELQARVGIATGLVVVGDLIGEGSAQEQSVVGETPNLAARLQALAEPDAVVIAASTRRLVGDLFEYRDLGAVEVKGIADAGAGLAGAAAERRREPVRGVARLDIDPAGWPRRGDRAAAAAMGARQGGGGPGRAGLGRARPRQVAHRRGIGRAPSRRAACPPALFLLALSPGQCALPVHRPARSGGGVRAGRSACCQAGEARGLARPRSACRTRTWRSSPICCHCRARSAILLPNLSPQRKKERTLEALIRQLEGSARRQPVVMVFEDAHWIDPTSRELLDLIVERVRSLPVLLIVTFRPEFQPPWIGQPHVTMLALNRLDRRDRTALADADRRGKALPDDVVAQIVERTDGVPLFIEELTKSVLESGLLREEADRYVLDGPLPPLAIPTSLHASLMARLDRLASVRHVAQIGAAIGRWFRYTLLRAVSGLPEDELQASLARLVASELVFQSGTPPDAVYTFKHALVQEAAYGSLLRNARQQLHGRIAEALEAHFPELMDSQPELFARHYAEAGLAEKSVFYWSKAAQRSVARSAMAEAAAQFQKATGPADAVAGRSRTSAPGARIAQFPGRGVAIRQRLRRAGNRADAWPRTRAVGAAGFALGVLSGSLRPVALS